MTSKIPQGRFLNVTGDSRVKKIRFNSSGTVDVVVLDKPAKRNPKPKKKRARKKPNAKRTKKRTVKRVAKRKPNHKCKANKKATKVSPQRRKIFQNQETG